MLLALLERRYGNTLTVFSAQYAQKDGHQRLGFGVDADAIMERIVHDTMCEHAAMNDADDPLRAGGSHLAGHRLSTAIPLAPNRNIQWLPGDQILTQHGTMFSPPAE